MVACNALIQNEQLELQLVYRFPCLRRIASFRKKRIKFCNARAARALNEEKKFFDILITSREFNESFPLVFPNPKYIKFLLYVESSRDD